MNSFRSVQAHLLLQDLLYGVDRSGRVWFRWPLRNTGFLVENWITRQRTYILNNNNDVVKAVPEEMVPVPLDRYRTSLHKPVGFVLPGYQTLLLDGIALKSIDYS